MGTSSSLAILVTLTAFIIAQTQANALQIQTKNSITFVSSMNLYTVKENEKIGSHIYTLEAIDPNGRQVLYGIEDTDLFRVDSITGAVKVVKQIDREAFIDKNSSESFVVSATSVLGSRGDSLKDLVLGSTTKLNVSVFILDENDNAPIIDYVRVGQNEISLKTLTKQRPAIVKVSINEGLEKNSDVVDEIRAIDVDTSGASPLSFYCTNCYPEFELKKLDVQTRNDLLKFKVIVNDSIVYSPQNHIQVLNIVVTDGKFNTSLLIELTILDVQNLPPVFVGSTTGTIKENSPIDETILRLQAIDGDVFGPEAISIVKVAPKYNGRPVVYSFVNDSAEFKLNPLTGEVQVANKIDREAHLESKGIITLAVQAQETLNSDVNLNGISFESYEETLYKLMQLVDNSTSAKSEIILTIMIIDVNDSPPHWLNSSEILKLNSIQPSSTYDWYNELPNDRNTMRNYKLQVKENSPPGLPLTFGNDIFVYDLDYGENSMFDISIKNNFNLFDVEPKQIFGFGLVTLKLASKKNNITQLLDYENPNERNFIIELIASERNTIEGYSSIAQITISVININDNAPEFKESLYRANVREDASPGKILLSVQATDRDELSKNLIFSLHGQSVHLFNINKNSGIITVAQCHRHNSNVNQTPCLDYEQQKTHHLMVEVSDGQLSSKVPLTIFVEDASDNPPVFIRPITEVVIEEGSDKFEPPLRVEAMDADISSTISYSIVEGNFEKLFQINNVTGDIRLTRPIKLSNDADQNLNRIRLVIQASDNHFRTNATVDIEILDANDNAPEFVKSYYMADIYETAQPGQIVTTVRAFDNDKDANAYISYSIQRGSFKAFEIDSTTGNISVTREAVFNAIERSTYNLEVVATDHGFVPKKTSVPVIINILAVNKLTPEFDPQIQRIDIPETTTNRTIIHRMKVKNFDDLDFDSNDPRFGIVHTNIAFEPGNIEALDKNGIPVIDRTRLESMFSLESHTGQVVVNSDLDHDYASYINFTIYVRTKYEKSENIDDDNNEGYHSKKSVGYLIITVLDSNNGPPVFASPWSSQEPEIQLQMREELPVGTILTQLMASDADSKISHFKIDPPNEYFELSNSKTGTIVNKRVIDYESLMSQAYLTPGHRTQAKLSQSNIIQFIVYVYDSGLPQMYSKAFIIVEILPVNDCDCKFEQAIYEIKIRENLPPESVILQPRAVDLDYGDLHNSIRYEMIGENSDWFNIDPKNGLITVSRKGSSNLDIEKLTQSTMTFTIIGRDLNNSIQSKMDRSTNQSRFCSSTVKIHVEDINDNAPLFTQRVYETVAYDTDISDFPVIKLFVKDEDRKQSAVQLTNMFKITSGNTNDAFNITNDGQIYLRKPLNESLNSQDGSNLDIIQLHVQVRQVAVEQTGPPSTFTDECVVKINYVKINRYSPEWRTDLRKIVYLEENSPIGTQISQLRCTDKDNFVVESKFFDKEGTQSENNIRYWIKENGTNSGENEFFKIDPIGGNITTKITFDREARSIYKLIVACEDNGKPESLETIGLFILEIVDVDDNVPEFVIPPYIANDQLHRSQAHAMVLFNVEEGQSKGIIIGQIRAIDKDIVGSKSKIYCIVDGNEYQEFSLDRMTGLLYANASLDREKQSSYSLSVKVTNEGTCERETLKFQQLSSIVHGRTTNSTSKSHPDSSLLLVKVNVTDINDNSPIFKHSVYRAAAHHKSLMNTLVARIPAIDPDNGLNGLLTYKILETLMYKMNSNSVPKRHDANDNLSNLSKANTIRLIQFPFKIDQHGDVYTQQLLTQYPVMSFFVLTIEACEQAEPWRTTRTRLEIYLYETNNQLKIRINVKPRQVEKYKEELENVLSNATKYTAIINRPKSYNIDSSTINKQLESKSLHSVHDFHDSNEQEPSTTNIQLVFLDNYRIVNPSQVMEKFDLSSAQFLIPQLPIFNQPILRDLSSTGKQERNSQSIEISSLIDKIALASTQSEYTRFSLFPGTDWLDSPSAIIIVVTLVLSIIGFVLTLIGCCCTSRIKDHIIKSAMEKTTKQQTLQARINEEMLAAATNLTRQQDYMLHSNGNGYLSSFEAKKDCNINNEENMNILRNMDPHAANGRFSPSISVSHVNMAAHFYDVSNLDNQQNYSKQGASHLVDEHDIMDEEDLNSPLRPASKQNQPQRPRQQVPQ